MRSRYPECIKSKLQFAVAASRKETSILRRLLLLWSHWLGVHIEISESRESEAINAFHQRLWTPVNRSEPGRMRFPFPLPKTTNLSLPTSSTHTSQWWAFRLFSNYRDDESRLGFRLLPFMLFGAFCRLFAFASSLLQRCPFFSSVHSLLAFFVVVSLCFRGKTVCILILNVDLLGYSFWWDVFFRMGTSFVDVWMLFAR